jgi:hypothetical protein
MVRITLEEIVDSLIELVIKSNRVLPSLGVYMPDKQMIMYNPYLIDDKPQFILTILHEIVHHQDFLSELSEAETEMEAERLYKNRNIRAYLDNYLSDHIQRWWEE